MCPFGVFVALFWERYAFWTSAEIRAHFSKLASLDTCAWLGRFRQVLWVSASCRSFVQVSDQWCAITWLGLGPSFFFNLRDPSVLLWNAIYVAWCHDLMRYACKLGSLPDWALAMSGFARCSGLAMVARMCEKPRQSPVLDHSLISLIFLLGGDQGDAIACASSWCFSFFLEG